MTTWQTVARASEIPPERVAVFQVGDHEVAVCNVGGDFYAIDDLCTHRGASLTEGACRGTEVICPWHGARFDVRTGASLSPPASRSVAAYKVQVVGNEIQVDVP